MSIEELSEQKELIRKLEKPLNESYRLEIDYDPVEDDDMDSLLYNMDSDNPDSTVEQIASKYDGQVWQVVSDAGEIMADWEQSGTWQDAGSSGAIDDRRGHPEGEFDKRQTDDDAKAAKDAEPSINDMDYDKVLAKVVAEVEPYVADAAQEGDNPHDVALSIKSMVTDVMKDKGYDWSVSVQDVLDELGVDVERAKRDAEDEEHEAGRTDFTKYQELGELSDYEKELQDKIRSTWNGIAPDALQAAGAKYEEMNAGEAADHISTQLYHEVDQDQLSVPFTDFVIQSLKGQGGIYEEQGMSPDDDDFAINYGPDVVKPDPSGGLGKGEYVKEKFNSNLAALPKDHDYHQDDAERMERNAEHEMPKDDDYDINSGPGSLRENELADPTDDEFEQINGIISDLLDDGDDVHTIASNLTDDWAEYFDHDRAMDWVQDILDRKSEEAKDIAADRGDYEYEQNKENYGEWRKEQGLDDYQTTKDLISEAKRIKTLEPTTTEAFKQWRKNGKNN